jgi:hypothetical protein
MVSAVSLGPATRKPEVLLPYPLDKTATLYLSDNKVIRYSVIGVLPVPPTAKLPIHTVGTFTEDEGNTCSS